MHNQTICKLLLSFLLLSTLSVPFMTKSTHAYTTNNTIYIRFDGSVDPATAPIIRTGDVYTFSGDISSNSANAIVIEKTT